jgi:hypothetical protein
MRAQKTRRLGWPTVKSILAQATPVVSAADPDKIFSAVRRGHQAFDSIL